MKRINKYALLTFALIVFSMLSVNADEPNDNSPFNLVRTAQRYGTLQEAVDAAQSGDVIEVMPCSNYSISEYDEVYATNNLDYISEDGAEVYIEGKSLTFRSNNKNDHATLKNFAIVVVGQEVGLDYTFENLNFTGSSSIIFDNYEANANFGNITVTNCNANTCTSTSLRTLLKYPTHDLGSTHSSSAFLQWVQRPRNVHEKNGTTKTLIFTNNTVKGKLHPTNPGDDTDNIPAYTPFISGGAGVGNVTITGNNFGDYDHASNCVYGIVFQTVVDGATFNVSNNEAYLANKSSNFLWVGEYLPSKINNVSVNINNNNFYTGTKSQPLRQGPIV